VDHRLALLLLMPLSRLMQVQEVMTCRFKY
jgi:hypothetical protein